MTTRAPYRLGEAVSWDDGPLTRHGIVETCTGGRVRQRLMVRLADGALVPVTVALTDPPAPEVFRSDRLWAGNAIIRGRHG